MLRCIHAHTVDSFGDIPVGSLWADDSPYVTNLAHFVDVDAALADDDDDEEYD